MALWFVGGRGWGSGVGPGEEGEEGKGWRRRGERRRWKGGGRSMIGLLVDYLDTPTDSEMDWMFSALHTSSKIRECTAFFHLLIHGWMD